MNKYIVHINPIPGTDSPRAIEVEADTVFMDGGALLFLKKDPQWSTNVAGFAPGVWIYVEPKK